MVVYNFSIKMKFIWMMISDDILVTSLSTLIKCNCSCVCRCTVLLVASTRSLFLIHFISFHNLFLYVLHARSGWFERTGAESLGGEDYEDSSCISISISICKRMYFEICIHLIILFIAAFCSWLSIWKWKKRKKK